MFDTTTKYIIYNQRNVKSSIDRNLFQQIKLETLIDSGSPYAIVFSCLVVNSFIYFYFTYLVECLSPSLCCM